MKKTLILVINPGSTSTKAALYDGKVLLDSREILHSAEELKKFASINDQLDFRREAVLKYLQDRDIAPSSLAAIACRGGVVGQLESGAYKADKAFADASRNAVIPHPANLSPIIGYEIAKAANQAAGKTEDDGVRAYVYDPVCGCGVPERLYTLTGIPEIEKDFLTHVLNSRAVSIRQAQEDGVKFEDAVYIVAHLGGGITVNLIKDGRILDIIGDDEGGFSPERSGCLPARSLVTLCYSGKFTEKELQKRLKGQGGLMAYLGENDLRQVEKRIEEGDEQAKLVFDAMVLQTAKAIASMAAVTCGKVDKILLTGGMAFSERLTEELRRRVEFVAPVKVMAGTYEMEALANGVLRVLQGEEEAHELSRL